MPMSRLTAPWRIWVVAALLSGGLVACFPPAVSAERTHASTLKTSFVQAVFSSNDRATTYSLLPPEDDWPGRSTFTYHWRLELKAVDPAVGVDQGCKNHGVFSGDGPTFVWHHGNIGDPVRDDGCDHGLQGKYGHQGLITVRVRDNHGWECEATYKGTESSNLASVVGGVATLPECVDTCAKYEEAFAYWDAEFRKVHADFYKLRNDIEGAKAAAAKAERELRELEDIMHGTDELPYATGSVRKARHKLAVLTAKLKPLTKKFDDAANLRQSYSEEIDDCRGTRRTSRSSAGSGSARAPVPTVDCSRQSRALAKARGEAAAYKLLLRLTVPDLTASAKKLGTAAHALRRLATGSGRAKVLAAAAHLSRIAVSTARVASKAASIKKGAKANAAAVRAAGSALAACKAKVGG
jgi:hypothetical protein